MVKNYTSIQLSNCEPMRGYDRISWKRLPHVVHAVNSGRGGPPRHIIVPNYVAQDESYQFRTQMTFNKDTPLQDVPSHWRAMAKGETFGDWIILGTTSPPRLWNLSTNWMALYKERMVYVCLCSYPGVTLQLIQNIFWFFIPLKSMT